MSIKEIRRKIRKLSKDCRDAVGEYQTYGVYKHPSDYFDNAFNAFVSPRTKDGKLNSGALDKIFGSKIIIILHDWASCDRLDKMNPKEKEFTREHGYSEKDFKKTNKKLKHFIEKYPLKLEKNGKEERDYYITNIFPYLKPKTNSHIHKLEMNRAFKSFCLKEIEIIEPEIIICMGNRVYPTFLKNIKGLYPKENYAIPNKKDSSIEPFKLTLPSKKEIFVYSLPHPAAWTGKKNFGDEWKKLKNSLANRKTKTT